VFHCAGIDEIDSAILVAFQERCMQKRITLRIDDTEMHAARHEAEEQPRHPCTRRCKGECTHPKRWESKDRKGNCQHTRATVGGADCGLGPRHIFDPHRSGLAVVKHIISGEA